MAGQIYQPYFIEGADRDGAWVITADHARNTVPDFVAGGDLGVAADDMARHIAFDPGAEGVARALGAQLNSPAIWSNFSRLVIDPNRGMDDPTLVMKLYDGTLIPANRHLTEDDFQRRLSRCYTPYHDALADLLAARNDPVICAVHSFTPQLRGRDPRPWHIGILTTSDRRLADPVLDLLRADPDLCVGDNAPYKGHLPKDTVDRHAVAHGRLNVLIELRNDLIETPAQQQHWAARLAPVLAQALSQYRSPEGAHHVPA